LLRATAKIDGDRDGEERPRRSMATATARSDRDHGHESRL
jgi:hypothetical protein